jgi:hypothetical protein
MVMTDTLEIREMSAYDVTYNGHFYRWDVLLDDGSHFCVFDTTDTTTGGKLHEDVVNANVGKLLSHVRAHHEKPKSRHLPAISPYKTRYLNVVVMGGDDE